jgi:hypothetical protein
MQVGMLTGESAGCRLARSPSCRVHNRPGSGIGFTAEPEGRKGVAHEARELRYGPEPLDYHTRLGR